MISPGLGKLFEANLFRSRFLQVVGLQRGPEGRKPRALALREVWGFSFVSTVDLLVVHPWFGKLGWIVVNLAGGFGGHRGYDKLSAAWDRRRQQR